MSYKRKTERYIDEQGKNCVRKLAWDGEILHSLAELEDKIERGELVENTVMTYVNMARTDSKTLIDKALKFDELNTKIASGTLIEFPRIDRYVDVCYGLEKYFVQWVVNGKVKSRTFWSKKKAEKKLKELQNDL